MTPFIDCLNNEKVSEKAHEIAIRGLHNIVSYNLVSDATASTIVDILNDRVHCIFMFLSSLILRISLLLWGFTFWISSRL